MTNNLYVLNVITKVQKFHLLKLSILKMDNLYGYLIVLKLNGQDKYRFPISNLECIIGKSPACFIRLYRNGIAWKQCKITIEENGMIYLENLNHKTPIYVQNKEVTNILLKSGEIFKIKDTEFRWESNPNKSKIPIQTKRKISEVFHISNMKTNTNMSLTNEIFLNKYKEYSEVRQNKLVKLKNKNSSRTSFNTPKLRSKKIKSGISKSERRSNTVTSNLMNSKSFSERRLSKRKLSNIKNKFLESKYENSKVIISPHIDDKMDNSNINQIEEHKVLECMTNLLSEQNFSTPKSREIQMNPYKKKDKKNKQISTPLNLFSFDCDLDGKNISNRSKSITPKKSFIHSKTTSSTGNIFKTPVSVIHKINMQEDSLLDSDKLKFYNRTIQIPTIISSTPNNSFGKFLKKALSEKDMCMLNLTKSCDSLQTTNIEHDILSVNIINENQSKYALRSSEKNNSSSDFDNMTTPTISLNNFVSPKSSIKKKNDISHISVIDTQRKCYSFLNKISNKPNFKRRTKSYTPKRGFLREIESKLNRTDTGVSIDQNLPFKQIELSKTSELTNYSQDFMNLSSNYKGLVQKETNRLPKNKNSMKKKSLNKSTRKSLRNASNVPEQMLTKIQMKKTTKFNNSQKVIKTPRNLKKLELENDLLQISLNLSKNNSLNTSVRRSKRISEKYSDKIPVQQMKSDNVFNIFQNCIKGVANLPEELEKTISGPLKKDKNKLSGEVMFSENILSDQMDNNEDFKENLENQNMNYKMSKKLTKRKSLENTDKSLKKVCVNMVKKSESLNNLPITNEVSYSNVDNSPDKNFFIPKKMINTWPSKISLKCSPVVSIMRNVQEQENTDFVFNKKVSFNKNSSNTKVIQKKDPEKDFSDAPSLKLMNKKSAQVIKCKQVSMKPLKSPKNITDIQGIKKLMSYEKCPQSSKNNLADLRGIKKLLSSPMKQKSPKNDLSDVRGVKRLMFPKKSPKNDLTDVKGIKKLLSSPMKSNKSPKNDLTNIKGIKTLMASPKNKMKSPKNDLNDVRGIKKMFSPMKTKSPKNDLSDVRGVKSLMTTKKYQKSPKNDLSDVRGVKSLMTAKKYQKSPKNDLSDVRGVKSLMTTKKYQKSPKNDITDLRGIKKLLSLPVKPNKSPRNDLSDVQGIKRLMSSKEYLNSPKNEIKELLSSPVESQRNDLNNEFANERLSFIKNSKSLDTDSYKKHEEIVSENVLKLSTSDEKRSINVFKKTSNVLNKNEFMNSLPKKIFFNDFYNINDLKGSLSDVKSNSVTKERSSWLHRKSEVLFSKPNIKTYTRSKSLSPHKHRSSISSRTDYNMSSTLKVEQWINNQNFINSEKKNELTNNFNLNIIQSDTNEINSENIHKTNKKRNENKKSKFTNSLKENDIKPVRSLRSCKNIDTSVEQKNNNDKQSYKDKEIDTAVIRVTRSRKIELMKNDDTFNQPKSKTQKRKLFSVNDENVDSLINVSIEIEKPQAGPLRKTRAKANPAYINEINEESTKVNRVKKNNKNTLITEVLEKPVRNTKNRTAKNNDIQDLNDMEPSKERKKGKKTTKTNSEILYSPPKTRSKTILRR